MTRVLFVPLPAQTVCPKCKSRLEVSTASTEVQCASPLFPVFSFVSCVSPPCVHLLPLVAFASDRFARRPESRFPDACLAVSFLADQPHWDAKGKALALVVSVSSFCRVLFTVPIDCALADRLSLSSRSLPQVHLLVVRLCLGVILCGKPHFAPRPRVLLHRLADLESVLTHTGRRHLHDRNQRSARAVCPRPGCGFHAQRMLRKQASSFVG